MLVRYVQANSLEQLEKNVNDFIANFSDSYKITFWEGFKTYTVESSILKQPIFVQQLLLTKQFVNEG